MASTEHRPMVYTIDAPGMPVDRMRKAMGTDSTGRYTIERTPMGSYAWARTEQARDELYDRIEKAGYCVTKGRMVHP